MVLILVLVLVALLLIVALAVIAGSNGAASSTTAVSIKYRVLNAAEGAANSALDDLVRNPAESNNTHLTGTLNGEQWDAWIRANNLLSNNPTSYTDPATGKSISVPSHTAYLYGVAADNGGHTTYVEAIAAPAPPLTMPSGALNAAVDVLDNGPMAITSDPTDTNNPDDADVHANRDILGSATKVQGATYALRTDDLPAVMGEHTGTTTANFPSAPQVSEAVRTANLSALAGQQYTGDQIAQTGTHTYTGNVYVNGDLRLSSSTVTFALGNYVYINGNLCLTGAGQLSDLNGPTTEIVVSGNVEIANGGVYQTAPGQNTLMIVLGLDGPANPCSSTNLHAVDFQAMLTAPAPIGTIFAPNGSIDLTGDGALSGAFDAGDDLIIEGTNTNQGMQYDIKQASTTINTGTLTFQSYIEY
jgi:hypothetical protein